MSATGRVTKWNDGRGYGFIRPAEGGADVFLHATDVRSRRRPQTGDSVRYRVVEEDGRLRAVDARLGGFAPSAAGLMAAATITIALALIAAWASGALTVPPALVAYAAMTVVTFIA